MYVTGESSMSRPTLSTEDVAKAQPIYVPKQNFMLAYRPHHFVDQHGRSYYLHQPTTAIINGDSSHGWHRYLTTIINIRAHCCVFLPRDLPPKNEIVILRVDTRSLKFPCYTL